MGETHLGKVNEWTRERREYLWGDLNSGRRTQWHRWGLESDNLGTRTRRPRTKETSHEGGQVACLYGQKSPNTAGANPGSGECPFPSNSTSLSCQIASCKQILFWTLDILLFWEVSLRVFHKRNRDQPFAKQISFSFNLFSKEWVPSIVPGWFLPQRKLARACSWNVHVKKTVYSMIRL